MKQRSRRIYLMIILFLFTFSFCPSQTTFLQTGNLIWNNEVYGGYGIFSFYKIENAAVYASTHTTGLIFGGYLYHFNHEYSIGILCGTEQITPEIKNSPEKYYVKRVFALARINKVLVHKENLDLYISALGGINQEDKKLIDGRKTTYEPIYDFVLIGLKYSFGPYFRVFAETGYNRLSLFRCGIGMSF